jgi:hypothetical protein
MVLWVGAPTAVMAGVFATVADDPVAAAAVGAVVGLFIGIALLAFPDLDRGGPADNDDFMVH